MLQKKAKHNLHLLYTVRAVKPSGLKKAIALILSKPSTVVSNLTESGTTNFEKCPKA